MIIKSFNYEQKMILLSLYMFQFDSIVELPPDDKWNHYIYQFLITYMTKNTVSTRSFTDINDRDKFASTLMPMTYFIDNDNSPRYGLLDYDELVAKIAAESRYKIRIDEFGVKMFNGETRIAKIRYQIQYCDLLVINKEYFRCEIDKIRLPKKVAILYLYWLDKWIPPAVIKSARSIAS
jgi:hypothetical protein